MEAVYLKGVTGSVFENTCLMKKNKQYVFVHHIPGYMSKIEFRDADNYFSDEVENDYMFECNEIQFTELYQEALKVINSKL